MGDAGSFYPADRWNPDGYFEQPDIHAVNRPLIHGPWGRLAYFKLPTATTILKRAARRREQIAGTAEKYDRKVVKETRFCLTLQAWLACSARIRRIIVCLRDPDAVVRSIQNRNWISQRHGYQLWHTHLERLLKQSDTIPLWFVRYENLLNSDTFLDELRPALRFFEMTMDERELRSLQEKVVKPEWNHFRDRSNECPQNVRHLWRDLLERHATQLHPTASEATATSCHE